MIGDSLTLNIVKQLSFFMSNTQTNLKILHLIKPNRENELFMSLYIEYAMQRCINHQNLTENKHIWQRHLINSMVVPQDMENRKKEKCVFKLLIELVDVEV